MTKPYVPPLRITAAIVSSTAEILQMLGRIYLVEDALRLRKLRKMNQIRKIQGSLAIEGNTLMVEEITAIMDGKHVIALPCEYLKHVTHLLLINGLEVKTKNISGCFISNRQWLPEYWR